MRSRSSKFLAILLWVAVGLGGFQPSAPAATRESTLEERVADIEAVLNSAAPVADPERASRVTLSAADNAWMLTSAALVLLMTGPGLALFYGGLVREKNVLGTMMHSLFLMALMSVLWAVYGYSMAFGEGNSFVGNLGQYFLLRNVGMAPNLDYAPTVPHQTFMLFQLMFAIITPALISGAFAERMKFSAFVLFTILWATFVYFPLAHMVWGKGGLFNWALGGKVPALDFAGGTVVHISSGVSALVCAAVLGRRLGFPREPMVPHNVVLSLIGAGLLWIGWFGFNAGSALGASGLATRAFAATHFASAAAALSWAGTEWLVKGKPSVLGAVSGMVAGLVAVTPASGFVTIPAALGIGLIAGMICYLAVARLKRALGYDDALDAFGVHGMGGTVGALLTGVFANAGVNPLIATTFKPDGANPISLTGSAGQFVNQAEAAAFTWILSAVATVVILKIVDAMVGLRVTEEEETQGLDVTQHGEEAYNN